MTQSISSSQALRDQRVVVVGGTSGMGLGAARAAAAAGADVIVAGRRPMSERGPIPTDERRLQHVLVDVTDEASVRDLFDDVGALDHLFVTAAPPSPSTGRDRDHRWLS